MRIMTRDELNAYQESMMNPGLTKAVPGDSGHVEDHHFIADAISLMVPVVQTAAVKTGDNAWNLGGDILTDGDMEGFLSSPMGYMIAETPNDWQGVSASPVSTEVNIHHVGLYGLMVELLTLKSRIEALEAAATNPE